MKKFIPDDIKTCVLITDKDSNDATIKNVTHSAQYLSKYDTQSECNPCINSSYQSQQMWILECDAYPEMLLKTKCFSGGVLDFSDSTTRSTSTGSSLTSWSSVNFDPLIENTPVVPNTPKKCESERKKSRSVLFDTIHIREYQVTIGDNPSCKDGPPITLHGNFHNSYVVGLEDYEKSRKERKCRRDMFIDSEVRMDLIQKNGCTKKEIYARMTAVRRAQNQRQRTITFLPISRFEEALQSASRKLKRCIILSK